MPTVPLAREQVQPGQLPGPRVSGDVSPEGFGSGVGRLSSGVALSMIADDRRKADDMAVMGATNSLKKYSTALLYDPKNGMLNKRGKDSFGSQTQAMEMFDSRASEIESSLGNENQKEAFRRSAFMFRGDTDLAVQRHVSVQIKEHDAEEFTSFMNNSHMAVTGAVAANDFARVGFELGSQETEALKFAERNGKDAEWAKSVIEASASKTHYMVVETLAATGKDKDAAQYLALHNSEIRGDENIKAHRLVETGSIQGESQRIADVILQRGGTREQMYEDAKTMTGGATATGHPEGVDANFNTVLSPGDEAKFKDWKAKYAPRDSGADYDLRGAFKAGLTPAANGHWPDTFKKPNHDTFSNESKYAAYGNAGHWVDGQYVAGTGGDPKIRDAVTTRLDHEFIRQDKAQREHHEKATNIAIDLIESGMPFENLPVPVMAELSVGDRSALRSYSKTAAKGENVETDWERWYSRMDEASHAATQARFLERNLMTDRPYMADAQFTQLVHLQASLRGQTDKKGIDEEELTGYRTNKQIVDDTLTSLGIDTTPKAGSAASKDVVRVRRAVDEQIVQFKAQHNRKPNFQEVEDIVDMLTVKGAVKGAGVFGTDKTMFAFQLEGDQAFAMSLKDIPRRHVEAIQRELQRTGQPVTNDRILSYFNTRLQMMLHNKK